MFNPGSAGYGDIKGGSGWIVNPNMTRKMSGNRLHVSKDHRKLLKKAQKQGWEVTRTKKNHTKWKSPRGGMVIHSSSPSDNAADKNFISQLRRNGLDI